MRLYELNEDINQKFQFYDEMGDEKWREKDDCTIVAMAIACNISYEEARNALMKNGKETDAGVSRETVKNTLDYLGIKWKCINPRFYLDRIYGKGKVENKPEELTMNEIIRYPEFFKDIKRQIWSYHTMIEGHTFAIINGKMEDHGNLGCWRPDEAIVYGITAIINDGNNIDENIWCDELREFINNYDKFIPQFIKAWNETGNYIIHNEEDARKILSIITDFGHRNRNKVYHDFDGLTIKRDKKYNFSVVEYNL